MSAWREQVGLAPFTVTVEERPAKKHVVYLRWWDSATENWQWRSLKTKLVGLTGRALEARKRECLAKAEAQYEVLAGKRLPASVDAPPLTLGNTWALITDPRRGCYPTDTPHRREVHRALSAACRLLGKDLTWTLVDKARYRELGRLRFDELKRQGTTGYRGAEITIARLAAVASWLRTEDQIPVTAGIPGDKWKDELKAYAAEQHGGDLPSPHRPRHTLAEMRKLLEVSWDIDPRFGLLMHLGAELRLGQVARARRSDLDLERGLITIRGRRQKKGTIVVLTKGQLAAVERALTGYLADCEAKLPDYYLFPRGKLIQGRALAEKHGQRAHIGVTTKRAWFLLAEAEAEIEHIPGRGGYGVRRQSVDAGKSRRLSREGLQALGGWSDTQVPDSIYAEQEQLYAAEEAAEVRAGIRGEEALPYPHRIPSEAVEGEQDTAPTQTKMVQEDGEWACEELNLGPHAYQASGTGASGVPNPRTTNAVDVTPTGADSTETAQSAPEYRIPTVSHRPRVPSPARLPGDATGGA